MSGFELNAEPRTDVGKGASRRLRRANKVPAIVYGAAAEPEMLTLVHHEINHALENEAFYSHILDLKVGGKAQKVVLRDLQRHPNKPLILHVDFQRVSAEQKLHMHVPLHFIGDDVAPGVKIGGGIVSHLMNDVEVTCLPKDLPEYLEVDLSTLDLNQSVHMSDLKLPAGVEIPSLAQGPEHDLPVASIHLPRAAKEEEAPAEAAEGGEAAAASAEGESKE